MSDRAPFSAPSDPDRHDLWRARQGRRPVTPDSASRGLALVPVSLAQANEHVSAWHRHNKPVPGAKFCVGAADDYGILRAVAIAGRPVARGFDDGQTIEVVRVASDGSRNACSMLYGACQRAAFALGYRRIITYTEADESGSSLRASGWRVIAQRPPRKGWSVPSRPRDDTTYRSTQRQLWEVVALREADDE